MLTTMQPGSGGQAIQSETVCMPFSWPGTAFPSLPAASSRPTEPASSHTLSLRAQAKCRTQMLA